MVQFHEHIISDLLEDPNGGLVVLSSGLSLSKLIATLLSLHSSDQGTLLILSANPCQRKSILISNPNPNFNDGSVEITSELPAHQRNALYSSGGVYFITSRILIVDLLTSRIPTSKIAGILILNAHSLSETSTEAFIVRIMRSLNKNAYIRAFSDKPFAMVSGFAKAERIMKCLFVRKLHLWPRFQVYVSQELEKSPSEVVDIRVPMNSAMKGIQKAIIEVMDACLKEMRRTNKVDVEDLTVENGLFKSFDEIIKRQLDPIWHTLGKKTKQLVSDLKTLRKLLDYLVRYDAVTYLKYLDSLRVSESFRSVWIFAESSYKIFEYAKKRVYHFARSEAGKPTGQKTNVSGKKRKSKESSTDKEASGGGVFLQEILEEPPKWKVLRDILEEIEAERKKQASLSDEFMSENDDDSNGIVLVACKDEHSCMQLEDCITNGPKKVMREEWEKYLLSKVDLKGYQGRQKGAKKKAKEPKGFGILDGVVSRIGKEDGEPSSINKQENDALLAAASAIKNLSKKETAVEDTCQHDVGNEVNEPGRRIGKSKKPLEKHIKTRSKSKTSDTSQVASPVNESERTGDNTIAEDGLHEGEQRTLLAGNSVLRRHTEDIDVDITTSRRPLPPVHFHALESDQPILDILKPSIIIAYHPDITFVREVEVYNAENPSKKLKVYFLFYEDSTEVQKFEASIRRENGAFESLIRQKSMMMIPVNLDDHLLGVNFPSESQSSVALNSITRKAGGRKETDKEMQVIVDMREFMSSLPNVLHQKGMRIIPVTLEVGDYILSPLICVERKSIQDLFGSFTSGRLYHQIEMMVRYYRIPVLLIEFSQDKSFSFLSASDIGDDVTPNSIISKLTLLAMHFPRLRIVWSRSLHATAEIFASLKANQDEPDEAKATRVGVPSEEGIVENDVRAENYNTSAVEFLRRLPGVTDSNYRALMDGCSSLADLALLPVEKLADLMGGQKAARTLREFLDAKYPTML
ncbi:DNA repair endonuclease UVH1-like [Chenopodium quinoa]|uniref:DNA repair endonuclease UVH1-like n=1 Tax=Chenopodium quinoa TaxID=63459 RepID=UPI000B79456C|nr:DNA repair endonuclease UVH1-like [Chenopodium quinoa]